MIFRGLPFLDRIDAVARCGFPAVEFWRWRDKDLGGIAERAQRAGVRVATFAVDTAGPLTDGNNIGDAIAATRDSLVSAQRLGVDRLLLTVGNELPDVPRATQREAIVAYLVAATPLLEEAGVTLLVEPLNVLVDHKGYFLSSSAEALEIIEAANTERVKLLFDIYHQQITEGNLTQNIVSNFTRIGHFHIADVPGRHEPGTGEINYSNLLSKISELGYRDYVGLEFRPSVAPEEALACIRQTLKTRGT
jgi:hydroxypyruvate isomerase